MAAGLGNLEDLRGRAPSTTSGTRSLTASRKWPEASVVPTTDGS